MPVSVGLRGDVKMFMRNVVTGEVETREMRNTILASYLNRLFTSTYVLDNGIIRSVGNNVRIGTSGQPASRSDTGIIGTQLAAKAGTVVDSETYPPQRTITAVFAAGTGTGTIQEVVLFGTVAVARQVVSPALVKTDQHELTVVWTITLSREADSWSGTIPAGQRDGTTDINWVATINNAQLKSMALPGTANYYFALSMNAGTSNAASDLLNDGALTIKGTTLGTSIDFREVLAYTTDAFYRDYRIGFETTKCNGLIGEVVLTLTNGMYWGRVTFDPPLDKIDTYRLYLTFRLAVVNAS